MKAPSARPTARSALRVLIANPSPDVYGSDLQMLESVTAFREHGVDVLVVLPNEGPLVPLLLDRGAEVRFAAFPVLRRADASPRGLVTLAWASLKAVGRLASLIRSERPSVVYVNTVTLPWWLLAARLTRTPSLCHVHEAEVKDRRAVRFALTAPLLLASVVVPNSRTTLETMCEVVPRLRQRARVIYNGVQGPATDIQPPATTDKVRLLVVGRLSPRKAPDVALEAVSRLRAQGLDVGIELCGTAFAGYEWFVQQLRDRSARPDLDGSVTFSGYVAPLWPAFARSNVVVAPSLGESFGNAVVEAQLAGRPVVATAVQGHLETVIDGSTGLLVPARDPDALSVAVRRLIDDPELSAQLASHARAEARRRFAPARFGAEMVRMMVDLVSDSRWASRRRG